jgi:holliday junction resolvase Hjr
MSAKSKGTNGEREIVRTFWALGWAALRTAGSGSSHYPSPDVIAGKLGRRFAIECKVTKETIKYFDKDEISQLQYFSKFFGAEPYVAVKFPKKEWFFFTIDDLKENNNSLSIRIEDCDIKGIKITELCDGMPKLS